MHGLAEGHRNVDGRAGAVRAARVGRRDRHDARRLGVDCNVLRVGQRSAPAGLGQGQVCSVPHPVRDRPAAALERIRPRIVQVARRLARRRTVLEDERLRAAAPRVPCGAAGSACIEQQEGHPAPRADEHILAEDDVHLDKPARTVRSVCRPGRHVQHGRRSRVGRADHQALRGQRLWRSHRRQRQVGRRAGVQVGYAAAAAAGRQRRPVCVL